MIQHLFSPELATLLGQIEELGFKLCLVGGITRDYFLSGKLGVDFDFEIRSSQEIKSSEWSVCYKKLLHFFQSKGIAFTELPYLITRIETHGLLLEFASPRTEENQDDKIGHHHFKANLDTNLSYEDSFRRRDFTINAIGIELDLKNKAEKIIDPFNGLNDLKEGKLKEISEAFFDDSVRFLRLIRFSLKFKSMTIESQLLNSLKKFNLNGLSVFHFTQELFKSNPGEFLNSFSTLIKSHKLILSDKFLVWTKYHFPEHLKTKEEILVFVFKHDESDAEKVLRFFSLPEKKLRELKSMMMSLQRLQAFSIEDHLKMMQLPLMDALSSEIFKDYKNVDEKKEWQWLIEAEAFKLFLTPAELAKRNDLGMKESHLIQPSLRSYYPYYLVLKKKLGL